MFEEFSPRFESSFRAFFMLWVIGWAVFNGFDTLRQYAVFGYSGTTENTNLLLAWFFNLSTSILALTLGIVLLFWASNVPNRIKKLRPITNIPFFTGLTIIYYLFPTISSILVGVLFNTDAKLSTFIFQAGWLLPSVVILVFHLLYYMNINKYNELLEESQDNPQAPAQPTVVE
jgi:hypothetical protein